MIGGMHEPTGYEMPTSAPVTAHVKSPTIVTGRFRTLEEADQVIRDGEVDMVGMTRAHIDLVRKTLAGVSEQVRPCIACNQGCVGNLLGPRRRVACAVNPGAGSSSPRATRGCPSRARLAVSSWSAPAPPAWRPRVSRPCAATR